MPATIAQILQQRAADAPDRQIFCFLKDGKHESETLTYRQLDRRAREIAVLLKRHTTPGDRALLLFQPGLEFICALFGCFYARVTAAPLSPPRLDGKGNDLASVDSIARNASPAVVLASGESAPRLLLALSELNELSRAIRLRTDAAPAESEEEILGLDVKSRGHDLAILQYTSGSTGSPKGVMLTHDNIMANAVAISLAMPSPSGTIGVSWLPFHHDMGLIGNVLSPLHRDRQAAFLAPAMLLQRPSRWLEAITRYGAQISGGPNFAYDYCVRRVTEEQKAQLDLSTWRIAFVGAEPVSPATLDRFSEAFAGCGFRREAFYPCYGLAEATLLVSGGEETALPVIRDFQVQPGGIWTRDESMTERSSATQTLTGCGHAWPEHEIRIVHPETRRECDPGEIGEIWFRGPSVAQGYWNREQETQDTFHALIDGTGEGPFLRTGDLGFLDDGELFIAGRLKDLILIRGHNIFPQDVEETVCEVHAAIRPNSNAVIGCPGEEGEERLVVLQELDRQTFEMEGELLDDAVRKAVAQRHQVQASEVVFVRKGSLPKTTSGKIRRSECRARYLSRQLETWERGLTK